MEDLADPEVPAGRGRWLAPGRKRTGLVNGNGAVATMARQRQRRSALRQRHGISSRELVLNASYEPINVCTVRRAAVLVLKSRAEVLAKGKGRFTPSGSSSTGPCVIRLTLRAHPARCPPPQDHPARRCSPATPTPPYCGHSANGLPVDHVVPRRPGGDSTWENIVASCAPCNRKKGNRCRGRHDAPGEAAKPPGPTVFIRIAAPRCRSPGSRTCSPPLARLLADPAGGEPRGAAKRRADHEGGPSKCDFGRVSVRGRVDSSRPPALAGAWVGFRQASRTLLARSTVARRTDEAAG